MRINNLPLTLLLILCAVVTATAQTASTSTAAIVVPSEKSQPITIPKFDKPPTIDGKLDEEVWQKAAVLKDFYQIQPGDNTPPSKPAFGVNYSCFTNLYITLHKSIGPSVSCMCGAC